MADDYTANIFTIGQLGVGPGGKASGVIEIRYDTDWFKINLNRGDTYKFTLQGSLPLYSSYAMLSLYDSNGNILSVGFGNSKEITVTLSPFTPSTAGTYFLEARDLFNAVGGYIISADLVRSAMMGTTNADTLRGTSAEDNIVGLAGNDTLIGLDGNDFLFGDEGDDRFDGGSGLNHIYGGAGTDTIVYPFDIDDYVVSRHPTSGRLEVIQKAGGSDEVFEVEKVEFRDRVIDATMAGYWGGFKEEASGSLNSVFRFFNTRDKAFFYSSSTAERDMILSMSSVLKNNADQWPYVFQGSTYEAAHKFSGATPIFRFYNYNTGHHFFTASKSEADYVRAQSSSGAWPFRDEGIGYNAYLSKPASTSALEIVEVRRFYSPSLDRHFFTASSSEIEAIKLTGVWNDEGIAFYAEQPGGG